MGESANPSLDYIFEQGNKKINDTIKMKPGDERKTKVYCMEPYAQTMYEMYTGGFEANGEPESKDLVVDQLYDVRAIEVNVDSRFIQCEEVNSRAPVYVAFNEYPYSIDDLVSKGENREFKVILSKNQGGAYYGSSRQYNEMLYLHELSELRQTKDFFEVTITDLVKGGYIALYKNCVECFVPGSHAAANVIRDFDSYIGKTIPVIIDNYDYISKLYIVSYKKYINKTIHTRIHELDFSKKYKGVLTNDPSEFGMFIEIDGYFTGLMHKTEIRNYKEAKKKYKAGDEVEVYIRNIVFKDGRYRITYTFNEKRIDKSKLEWSNMKEELVGNVFDYYYQQENNKLYFIRKDGKQFGINVEPDAVKDYVYTYKKVQVNDIDVIKQVVNFNFVADE